jgi:hypothetical protein
MIYFLINKLFLKILYLEMSFLKSHFVCLIDTFSPISTWLFLLDGLCLFNRVLGIIPWCSYFTQCFLHHRRDHCRSHLPMNPSETRLITQHAYTHRPRGEIMPISRFYRQHQALGPTLSVHNKSAHK